MLPPLTVPVSLLAVLEALRPCFTAPTFTTFTALVTGMVTATGRRTVTGMLTGAGPSWTWPHDRAHHFFSGAVWDLDRLGLALARLIVATLVPDGAGLAAAVDDTLFKRWGTTAHGAAWQYDGAAKGLKPVSRGTCFVVLTLIVELPFLTRPVALPVLARLWRPQDEQSKAAIAADLVGLLAAVFPDHRIDVVADGASHGRVLRELPTTVAWTCRLPVNAALYQLAPSRTGKRGRPRTRGDKIGTPKTLAEQTTFTECQVIRYGRTDTVKIAQVACRWYGSFHARTVRVVLLRDPDTTEGIDLALVTTDLQTPPPLLVTRYAARWGIEVTFFESRQVLGVGQARNRTRRAVERTVPFGLLVYTVTVIWYTLHGHHPADAAQRRAQSPWYITKTEPSFEDMLVKLRRVIIAFRFPAACPANPTNAEITAVQRAWAAAAA